MAEVFPALWSSVNFGRWENNLNTETTRPTRIHYNTQYCVVQRLKKMPQSNERSYY